MIDLGLKKKTWKFALAAMASSLPIGVTFAQTSLRPPELVQPGDFPRAGIMRENARIKRALENAYRRALKKIPDKKVNADPWANIRSPESPPVRTKHANQ